jgi:hypothetical protein
MDTNSRTISREILQKNAAEAASFARSLAGESERAAVVLGAAKLDSLLELLLKRCLLPCPGGKDDLLDTERPLGTFSAKISAAYRLGLIDKDFEYALQAVRKIRNSFAHSIENETLSKAPHRDRLFEIAKILKGYEGLEEIAATVAPDKSNMNKDFATLCGVLTVLVVGLDVAAHVSEQVKPTMTFKLR